MIRYTSTAPTDAIEDKVDIVDTNVDSILYETGEIERHLHSSGSWFETASVPDAELRVADRIGSGSGAFRIDSGNLTWGSWVQILGSADTPARAGLYFDPHEVVIEDAERVGTYFVQITRGDSGAAGYAAGTYTEFVYSAGTNRYTGIIQVHTGRAPAGSKLWARCMTPAFDTGWMDFYFGIHEYEG